MAELQPDPGGFARINTVGRMGHQFSLHLFGGDLIFKLFWLIALVDTAQEAIKNRVFRKEMKRLESIMTEFDARLAAKFRGVKRPGLTRLTRQTGKAKIVRSAW